MTGVALSDIRDLMLKPEATLSKGEAVRLLTFYREQADRLLSSTPYQKQRVAANIVAARVLTTLQAPDGTTPADSPLERLIEAANGYERTSYCATDGCTSFGQTIECPGCGMPAKIVTPANWSAAARVLDFVVPKAATNVEQLQDDFVQFVLQQVMEAFDVANQTSAPVERRAVFSREFRERLSAVAT